MYTYKFNESKYKWVKDNRDKVVWEDFRKGIDDFPDYNCILNPYLVKHSDEHKFWADFFKEYFSLERNPDYHLVVRLVNSFMITGADTVEI